MFARREPELLRQRLSDIERDIKLGKGNQTLENEKVCRAVIYKCSTCVCLPSLHYALWQVEVLDALRQLGEKLTAAELRVLEDHSRAKLSDGTGFVQVTDRDGKAISFRHSFLTTTFITQGFLSVTGREALVMAGEEARSFQGGR